MGAAVALCALMRDVPAASQTNFSTAYWSPGCWHRLWRGYTLPARGLGLVGRNTALQVQCVVILAPKRVGCPKQKTIASEGVLWLDCTIRQQLSCSVCHKMAKKQVGASRKAFEASECVNSVTACTSTAHLPSHRLVSRTSPEITLAIATCRFEPCIGLGYTRVLGHQYLYIRVFIRIRVYMD